MAINNPGSSSPIGTAPSPDIGINTQDINVIRVTRPSTVSNTLAFNTVKSAMGGTLISGEVTAAGSTVIGTPPPNQLIRKLRIELTDNATMAAAGLNTLSVTLNGTKIYSTQVYIPATALDSSGYLAIIDIDLSCIGFTSGASGTLAVTLGAALATGAVIVNSYFTP